MSEDEVTEEHVKGIDLVIALGGDHTYLLSSALIKDQLVPLLGINTYAAKFQGALCTNSVDF